jgi:hypothetical protein
MLGDALDGLEPELGPMFGQFAELPLCPGAGVAGVAGVVCDDDELSLDDELVLLWPQAAAALPSMRPVSPAATIACFSRRVVMSITSLLEISRPASMSGEPWIAL